MPFNAENLPLADLEQLLDRHAPAAERVLLIRSSSRSHVTAILERLRAWRPGLRVTQLCHPGEELEGCENLLYPDPGYFRRELVDFPALRERRFQLVLLPYATDRRLHPDYHELDGIASALGAPVLACYLDGRALALERGVLALKLKLEVGPYLARKAEALEEICGFTGEEPAAAEDLCRRANKLIAEEWERLAPRTEEQIEEFYRSCRLYIHQLMKECDWRGARSDLAEAVARVLPPGCRVLDYGGGCGALSLALAGQGFRVAHLDLPGPLLEFARYRFARRGLEAQVLAADQTYPLREHYAAIICTHVLEHLPDPEDKLRHMARHLEPGGKLLLAVPFEPNPTAGEHPGMHLNRLGPSRYQELLEELGFRLELKEGELDVFIRPA